MKTEAEFAATLRRALRRARRGRWAMPLIKQMALSPNVYFAYERGELPMTVYQLYKFMQITGGDIEFLKEVFDDNWRMLPQHPHITGDR